jgi:hypothetical protein
VTGIPIEKDMDMATLLKADTEGYWGHFPELLAHLPAELDDTVDLNYFVLGSPADNAPSLVITQLAPGASIGKHAHVGRRVEIVIRGEMYAGDEVLHSGDVMMSDADEQYGPHTAGPDGAMTVEFFPDFVSAYSTVYPGADGQPVVIDWSKPGAVALRPAARQDQA